MIALAPGTKVYLASKPVSMRLGFDGLAALVRPGDLVVCLGAGDITKWAARLAGEVAAQRAAGAVAA